MKSNEKTRTLINIQSNQIKVLNTLDIIHTI